MSEQIDFELSALVRYGVSDDLVALLQCIEQATTMDGSPRYRQKAVYEMRRNILCHNYGKSMYELAHILIAITHAGPGFDELFYFDEAITPERFKQQIANWQTSDCLVVDTGSRLELVFCQSRRFEFHYRRINLMAAWSELVLFLVPALKSHLAVFEGEFRVQDIDQLIKTLQVQLSDYLRLNVQSQSKFREGAYWLSWIKQQQPGTAVEDGLNDQAVISFWVDNWSSTDFDYRKFSSVVESAYSLIGVMRQAKQNWQIEHAASLNQATAEGEQWLTGISTDELIILQQLDETEVELPMNTIARLGSANLADIKFLTGKDMKLASQLERDPALLMILPWSQIRLNLFGRYQAKIIGDLQNHAGRHVQAFISCADISTPDELRISLQMLMQRVSLARLACAHILIELDHERVPEILAEALTDETRATLRSETKSAVNDYLRNHTAAWQKQCESAFKQNQRAGFKSLPDISRIDDYAAGDECLQNLQVQYDSVEKHILAYSQASQSGPDDENLSRYDLDKTIFSRVFHDIYGASP